METRKYFVYNQARESFLSESVTVIDTTLEPLKLLRVMVEGLALNASTGLWLTPLTEIPKVPRLSPFDLIYLDGDGRVIQGAELLPGGDFPAFKERAASALVLPLKTMSLSKTLPGDQLVIEVDEQPVVEEAAKNGVKALRDSNGNAPEVEGVELMPESLEEEVVAPISRSDDPFRPRAIVMPLETEVECQDDQENEDGSGEPAASGDEAPIAQFMSLDEETESQGKAMPVATVVPQVVPQGVPQVGLPPVERTNGNGARGKSRTGGRRNGQESATQRTDEKAKTSAPEREVPLNVPLISVSLEVEKQPEPPSASIFSAPAVQREESAAERVFVSTGVAPAESDGDLKAQHAAIQRFIEEAKAQIPQKQSGFVRALRWLYPDSKSTNDRRGSIRRPSPELVAYYAEKGAQQAHDVGNISSTGVYLVTDERWPPGALIPLTLQRKGELEDSSGRRIRVQAGPARWGKDGIGLYFVFPTGVDLRLWESPLRRHAAETEPEYILREFRTARALGFVRRICAPVVEEVERLVQKELSNFRAASAVEVALKAESLIVSKPDADKMLAHPEIVMRIIELGSWADADLLQRFWAGLLAASCSIEGQDKSNTSFIDLLSVLTLIHVRILSGACARAIKVVSDRGDVSIYPTYSTADEICKIAGTNDFTKIHRAIAILSDLGLLEKSAHSSFVSYTEKAKTTPTQLGLEMCARCSGIRAEQ